MTRAKKVSVVESYLHGLGSGDFSEVPFAPDVSYESPLTPRLVGGEAIAFLSSLFPIIQGVEIEGHIIEGEYVATVFRLRTPNGETTVFDKFRVVDGRLQEINPYYDPAVLNEAAKLLNTPTGVLNQSPEVQVVAEGDRSMVDRVEQLHQIARRYLECLGAGDFEGIPYAEDVELRAPLCPGGSAVPLNGRANLKAVWWAPLPDLVSGVELIDTYVNRDASAVTAEFFCHIESVPCTLRVIDRFRIDSVGQITAQENFFDPRDVTNPGWDDQAG